MTTTTMTNLMRLLNLPYRALDSVIRTGEGHYLGRETGDVGYNAFFGRPSPVCAGPGLTNTLRVWAELTDAQRRAVTRLAHFPSDGAPIPLEVEFGVPVTAWLERILLPGELP